MQRNDYLQRSSRDGVLVKQGNTTNSNQNEKFGETNAPKRPKTIEAEVIRFKNKEEDWVAVSGNYGW